MHKKMGGICAETGYLLKLTSPTNLARLGHFPPASQAGRLAGPGFYVSVFSLVTGGTCQGGGEVTPSSTSHFWTIFCKHNILKIDFFGEEF